jgi:hypothetical protein
VRHGITPVGTLVLAFVLFLNYQLGNEIKLFGVFNGSLNIPNKANEGTK